MKSIQLPIGKPRVVSYLHHAFPLAILEGLGWKSGGNWLFNHYTQIQSAKEILGGGNTEIDFHLTPTHFFHYANSLHILNIKRSLFLDSAARIPAAIAELLQQGYYLQITLEERYVPDTYAWGKFSFLHESLLHEIDLEAGTVSLLGFNAEMNFGSRRIPLDDLVRAILECDLSGHYDPDGLKLVRAREERPTQRSPRSVLQGLEDYLGSRDMDERSPRLYPPYPHAVYGLATQEAVARFSERQDKASSDFDIRPLHLLWEHKCLMQERLEGLCAQGLLPQGFEAYQGIVRDANAARLLALKYRFTGADGIPKRIAALLRDLAHREKEILSSCLDSLQSSLAKAEPPEGVLV